MDISPKIKSSPESTPTLYSVYQQQIMQKRDPGNSGIARRWTRIKEKKEKKEKKKSESAKVAKRT
jgi:hypothetical protein